MTNHLHPATETIEGARMGCATSQNEALARIEQRVGRAKAAGDMPDHLAAEVEALCRLGLGSLPTADRDLLHTAAHYVIDSVILVDIRAAEGRRDDEGDWSPIARTIPPEQMRGIFEGAALVRSIEARHGKLTIPLKWLRAVIDDPSWLQQLPRGVVAGAA